MNVGQLILLVKQHWQSKGKGYEDNFTIIAQTIQEPIDEKTNRQGCLKTPSRTENIEENTKKH